MSSTILPRCVAEVHSIGTVAQCALGAEHEGPHWSPVPVVAFGAPCVSWAGDDRATEAEPEPEPEE